MASRYFISLIGLKRLTDVALRDHRIGSPVYTVRNGMILNDRAYPDSGRKVEYSAMSKDLSPETSAALQIFNMTASAARRVGKCDLVLTKLSGGPLRFDRESG